MYDYSKVDDLILKAESLSATHHNDDAFKIISEEIDNCDNRYLNDYVMALNFVRNTKALDWIERNAGRTDNISINWGHLAALSDFSWSRAEKWLNMGRPMSLIAIDAVYFCTTIGNRANQSALMQQIKPKLIDAAKPEAIATKLTEYLKTDNVPRTRDTVNLIIKYIFDAEQ